MESDTEKKDLDEQKKPLFRNLAADDDDIEHTEVESMCINCEENGITRLLLTKIPFFKDVILMSFSCPHCGYSNNEIKPAGQIQDKGIKISLDVSTKEDLNRKVVKQESASFSVPELELESPAFSQKGVMTTVEGLLLNTITGLEQNQIIRRHTEPELAASIDTYIGKIRQYMAGHHKFTLFVEDMSGNSFVENPSAPAKDPAITVEHFTRSKEQDERLGLSADVNQKDEKEVVNQDNSIEEVSEAFTDESVKQEVLTFQTNCTACQAPVEARMKIVDIPHFKEVLIMSSACSTCGYKTNEVKPGAGVEPKGVRIIFQMTDPEDLNRDVLKSDTCALEIPELDFQLSEGSLGGRFTTIEGLIVQVKEQLESINPFHSGDSSDVADKKKMEEFVNQLDKITSGEHLVKIILDDPVGNSYIQNVYAPDDDPELHVEYYERTFEQNEELGLNDIKTENYEDKQ